MLLKFTLGELKALNLKIKALPIFNVVMDLDEIVVPDHEIVYTLFFYSRW